MSQPVVGRTHSAQPKWPPHRGGKRRIPVGSLITSVDELERNNSFNLHQGCVWVSGASKEKRRRERPGGPACYIPEPHRSKGDVLLPTPRLAGNGIVGS